MKSPLFCCTQYRAAPRFTKIHSYNTFFHTVPTCKQSHAYLLYWAEKGEKQGEVKISSVKGLRSKAAREDGDPRIQERQIRGMS